MSRAYLSLLLIAGGITAQQPPAPERSPSVLKQRPRRSGIEELRPGSFFTVPSLIGFRPEQLPARLEAAGLRLGSVEHGSSDQPEGLVFAQKPDAGLRVDRGTPVDVVVSRGLQRVVVPGVIGQPLANAREILAGAGLVVGEVLERPSEEPPQTVVDQNPGPKAVVMQGSAVSLTIAAAPIAEVAVPNLIGREEKESRRSLGERGLRPGAREVRHDDRAAGTIVAERPEAGARVPRGTAVDLVVSSGPERVVVPPPVPVALVVGAALAAAAVAAGTTWRLRKRRQKKHDENPIEKIEIRTVRDLGQQRLGRAPEPQSRISLVVRRDDGKQQVRKG